MKILLISLTVFFAVVALLILRKARKDAERIFNSDYENLVRAIRKPPTETRYYTILKEIHRMKKTPGVNHEKMDVVDAEFRRAYKKC
jgi:hypothetical protein